MASSCSMLAKMARLFPLLCLGMAATVHGEELRRRGQMGALLARVGSNALRFIRQEHAKGIYIFEIVPGGPAEKVGLQVDDVLVKIDGERIKDVPSFLKLMRRYYAGDTVTFTVRRHRKLYRAELTFADRPKETSNDHEVIYDSVLSDGKRLRTYITKPHSDAPSPAILLIPMPSRGRMEYLEDRADHPLKQTVNRLTRAGFVTMRLDRAGVGDSDGEDSRRIDLHADVEAFRGALTRLQAYDFVDSSNVYVFGMDLGAALAPLVAEGTSVKGVAVFGATVARPWSDCMIERARRRWRLEEIEADKIERRSELLRKYIRLCEIPGSTPLSVLQEHPELKEIAVNPMQEEGTDYVLGFHRLYFQQIAAVDFSEAWSRLNTHVLVMWGKSDFRANLADAEFIVQNANKKRPGQARLMSLEHIDHVFFQAEDQEESFVSGYREGEFNPAVVRAIRRWIKKIGRPST